MQRILFKFENYSLIDYLIFCVSIILFELTNKVHIYLFLNRNM